MACNLVARGSRRPRGPEVLVLATLLLSAGCASQIPPPSAATFTTPTPETVETAAAARSRAIGAPAPDFLLPDMNQKPVRLADFRGQWVVLYFYPQDDTPGCTCEATEFTRLLEHFHELSALVIGISPDRPGNHRFFAEKYGLHVTLLSDLNHQVMTHYGAWTTSFVGNIDTSRVIRSTFIIDPAGRIAAHWPEVIPQGHAQRVAQRLRALQSSALAGPPIPAPKISK